MASPEPLLALIPHQLYVLDVTPIRELMLPLSEFLSSYTAVTNLSLDKLNYLAIFLLCYPTALIHRMIGNTFIRHLYSLILGLMIVIYMVGNEVYHSIFSALVTYIVLYFFRGATQFIWIWSFGYMTASHIYRMYIDYMGWTVDFTIVQMVLTLKMCALACNVKDGHFPNQDLSSYQKNASISKNEFPSLFQYFSYVYYWCTILPGPFFEYKEFIAFMDRSMFPNGRVPAGSLVAFLKVWFKLLFTFGGVFLSSIFPVSRIISDEFDEYNFVGKVAFLLISMSCLRCNYYTGWLMSEGAIILNGFSYNGEKDGVAKWDRLSNIKILGVEFASSLKLTIDNWNLGTARFLKHYVYFRVSRKPVRPGQQVQGKPKGLPPAISQLIVFVVSAFWHGFYPGYYFFFISVFFFKHLAGLMEKILTRRVYQEGKTSITNYIYTALCILATLISLNYCAISFVMLSFENAIIGFSKYYWSFHIIVVVLLLLIQFRIIRPPREPKTTQSAPAVIKKTD